MDGTRPENRDERELVRRFSRGLRRTAARCPSELELAAYVDGLASEGERTRIEGHLALCPQCLEGIVQAQQLAAAAVLEAPSRVRVRAEALVPTHRVLGLPRTWRVAARWAAAAAATAALSLAGLQAGSAAARARRQAAAQLASELSFQPSDAYPALLGPADMLGDLAAQAEETSHEHE